MNERFSVESATTTSIPMSGIAPGSYLAYGINVQSARNEIIGVKRERTDDVQGLNSSSLKGWKSVESSEALKAVARSKYKCSLCGQVDSTQSAAIMALNFMLLGRPRKVMFVWFKNLEMAHPRGMILRIKLMVFKTK